ncbi:secreted RxLR effector protein 161-like [Pistacia vera]|uniref:secreted RxLR effector protein 161-like n=1 Tax=Pistacia vera TaxID=55513 RepID=UPI0012632E1F|nr:secreted RxLR effector protein 161-like [Pistacia vera]
MALGTKLSKEDSNLFDQPTLYRSIVRGVQYLTHSRPDLSFAMNRLSQFLQYSTIAHWIACKRVLRYIKGISKHGLIFRKNQNFLLEGYANADWASDIGDRRSTSGYRIFLGGNLVQWCSGKQRAVALSSTEAEYRALRALSSNLAFHARTKYIEIDDHYVRELAAERKLCVQYVASE